MELESWLRGGLRHSFSSRLKNDFLASGETKELEVSEEVVKSEVLYQFTGTRVHCR